MPPTEVASKPPNEVTEVPPTEVVNVQSPTKTAAAEPPRMKVTAESATCDSQNRTSGEMNKPTSSDEPPRTMASAQSSTETAAAEPPSEVTEKRKEPPHERATEDAPQERATDDAPLRATDVAPHERATAKPPRQKEATATTSGHLTSAVVTLGCQALTSTAAPHKRATDYAPQERATEDAPLRATDDAPHERATEEPPHERATAKPPRQEEATATTSGHLTSAVVTLGCQALTSHEEPQSEVAK